MTAARPNWVYIHVYSPREAVFESTAGTPFCPTPTPRPSEVRNPEQFSCRKRRSRAARSKWLIFLGALLVLWLLRPKGDPPLLDAATSSFPMPNVTEVHWLSENELLTFRYAFAIVRAASPVIRGRKLPVTVTFPSSIRQIQDVGDMDILSGQTVPLTALKNQLISLQGKSTLVRTQFVPSRQLVLVTTASPPSQPLTSGSLVTPSLVTNVASLELSGPVAIREGAASARRCLCRSSRRRECACVLKGPAPR